jgi:anthranilate/para-aminobenzoate synthase component II
MSKMARVGDRVQCPKSRGVAHVVGVSRDGKTDAIKCVRYHSQINPPACLPAAFRKNTQTKTEKGTVSLMAIKKGQA